MSTADELYRAARKAEIEQASWEQRARMYTRRGKLNAAEDALSRADDARGRAAAAQEQADQISDKDQP